MPFISEEKSGKSNGMSVIEQIADLLPYLRAMRLKDLSCCSIRNIT